MVIWKDVVGYEGIYKVSELGEVKSLERIKFCGHKGSKPQIVKEKILKQRKNNKGYFKVKLSKDSKSKLVSVHRILALAFIPNPDKKPNVNHIDANPVNNNLDNLEWCTQKENMQHASNLGNMKVKDKKKCIYNKKINFEIAEEIRKERKEGKSLKFLSEKYKMGISSISQISNNKIWKEVY